jgi:kynurenine 3-monooxygenase
MAKEKILILGAGLVGSLLSIFLAKKGFKVEVFEKRPDPRKNDVLGGRSINLALSDRGLLALEKAGVTKNLDKVMLPMHGRMIHQLDSQVHFQPYGKANQAINSVSRGLLNEYLIGEAEAAGAAFRFEHKCEQADIENSTLHFSTAGKTKEYPGDVIIGADGAYSVLRASFLHSDRFNFSQDYLPHGYKELNIPAGKKGEFQIDPNALHIWPRGKFMLIALPNIDKSFTCTLFLPFEGDSSFEALNSPEKVGTFFSDVFPDTLQVIPNLTDQFFTNPTSSLVTIQCFPWSKKRSLLLGDASHAIVPFFGQGMNAGFEDCRLLDEIINAEYPNWETVFQSFEKSRKPNTDAIARLANDNFIEMRDKVADAGFIWQKKLEARIHEKYPDKWTPLYTMVTFSNMPYSMALERGKRQESVMRKIREVYPMSTPPEAIDLEKIVGWLD